MFRLYFFNPGKRQRTFDGDVDDVVSASQPVRGGAAVSSGIAVGHV